jgi:hypothetical protein
MAEVQQQASSPTSESSGLTAVNDPQSPQSSLEIEERSDSASNVSTLDSSRASVTFPHDALPGWPQLAEVMAKTPDFAAFPRFRDLNIKSLLYYQVELTILRDKLHHQEYKDSGESGESGPFAERADFLVDVDNQESPQFKIIKDIRRVLKEYSEYRSFFSTQSDCLM